MPRPTVVVDVMSKPAFSIADIQSGMKRLNSVDPPAESKSKADAKPTAEEEEAMDRMEALYEKHNGDLDLIFQELQANPTKAKKPHNRPKNASEFAFKMVKGFYTLVEDEGATDNNADSKDAK